MRPLLGTYVEVGAQGGSPELLRSACARAFSAIEGVQRLMSVQDDSSDLARLNRSEGLVDIDPLTARVLRLALAFGRASGGLFNCLIGGEEGRRRGGLEAPPGGAVARGRDGDLELGSRSARRLRSVQVTLDGLAKGYAVDLAVRTLGRLGVESGWVNAGGDLRAFGEVVLPIVLRLPDGGTLPMGGLRDAAIATSLARAKPDERHPALLLAGRRELGVEPGVWCVLARRAWRADALTKVACQLREPEREWRVARLGGRLLHAGAASAKAS